MTSNTPQLQRYLTEARFEILPLRGALDRASQLPHGSTVTVTSSPAKGPVATVELAAELSEFGFNVVPHLAARMIADRVQLRDLLDRIASAGMSEVFVIAGDSPDPVGEFVDALSLLRAMDELTIRPERVGITGYPERHTYIPDVATIQAMADKSRYADYIVSQICYDPQTTSNWVKSVRERGIVLPIHIGVPGVLDVTKLLRISMKIGLGESMRFLRKQSGMVGKLLSRYTPADLLADLSPCLVDPSQRIAGWHFFTFNEVARTRQFRDEMVQRLEVPA